MSGFDEAFLHEVRERNDILSVVGDYVSLRKAGTSYRGLCPFHAEKSPSFHVHPDRNFFYCFGCQTGGDVLNFVREINGYSFPEAVKHLAERAGIPLPERTERESFEPRNKVGQASRETRDYLYAITRVAARYFRETLDTMEGEAARAYLQKRGISRETVALFGLGYAPDRWDGLVSVLQQEQIDLRLAESLGLVVKRQGGGYYDRFRHRLMFPIRSISGEVLGFSGRTLGNDPETAKYVNSPDSPIYQKGDSLFGVHEARQAMRKANRAILVEGNVDLVQLAQAGWRETVAPLGTALTPNQCRLLRRFVPQAVAIYDGDNAGREAARKAASLALQEGLALQLAQLPDGADPDSFVRERGLQAMEALLLKAVPAWEYLVARAVDETRAFDSAQGKKLAVEKLAPTLAELSSPAERALLSQQLAESLGLEVGLVDNLVRASVRRAPLERPVEAPRQRPQEQSFAPNELKLLELLALVPEIRALYFGRDLESLVQDERVREAASLLAECEGDHNDALACLPDGWTRDQLLRRLAEAPGIKDGLSEFERLVKVLRRDVLERELEAVRRDERRALLERDDEAVLRLQLEKLRLGRALESFKSLRD